MRTSATTLETPSPSTTGHRRNSNHRRSSFRRGSKYSTPTLPPPKNPKKAIENSPERLLIPENSIYYKFRSTSNFFDANPFYALDRPTINSQISHLKKGIETSRTTTRAPINKEKFAKSIWSNDQPNSEKCLTDRPHLDSKNFWIRLLQVFFHRILANKFADPRGIWRIRQITPEICRICQICPASVKINSIAISENLTFLES